MIIINFYPICTFSNISRFSSELYQTILLYLIELDFKTLLEQYHPRDQTSVPAFPSSSLNHLPTYVKF